jgi:glycosyltransferase involved in cell wall biosynthesis
MHNNQDNKTKLVIGITAYQSIALIPGQLKFLSSYYDVYLLAPNHESVVSFCMAENATHIPIKIERNPSPLNDMVTFFRLVKIFNKLKPEIVNLGTLKISFLGIIAAWFTGVKNRVYTCRGFRFQDQKGLSRMYLVVFERIISMLSTQIICISNSIAELGINKKLFNPKKVNVFSKGSSNGINLDVFCTENIDENIVEKFKNDYQLKSKFVYGFVGRMVDAKGIVELYHSFDKIYSENNNVRLMMVGSFYENEINDKNLVLSFNTHPGIIMCGKQPLNLVPTYMSMFNLLVLPTWREGFGNVLIQAAAMGIPVLSNNITGCKDAVSDGFNGKLIAPRDESELFFWMHEMYQNDSLRLKYAQNGKTWAQFFDSKIIWKNMLDFYSKCHL